MSLKIYRLELDENGEANAIDFTRLADAMGNFERAKKRREVFSARVDTYNARQNGDCCTLRASVNVERTRRHCRMSYRRSEHVKRKHDL
jgi:hypothetical protein